MAVLLVSPKLLLLFRVEVLLSWVDEVLGGHIPLRRLCYGGAHAGSRRSTRGARIEGRARVKSALGEVGARISLAER